MTHEKPRNGLAGLKYWRHDLIAGFMVAMISTPFSIGIAVASGAPPITGLTSAIIAGFVLPFLGGSYVTISGPAAGLAPAIYGAMLTLGAGSLAAGYPLLLPVICLAGIIQLALSRLKAARFAAFFPVPVVEGMLASIGLMIIAKQLPTLLGHKFLAHEFWGILMEAPHELLAANWGVLFLGLGTLLTIVVLNKIGHGKRWASILPPQIMAVGIGTVVSQVFLHLDKSFLIKIPENPLAHGIVLPDFAGLVTNPHLWLSAIVIAVTLTLIDGIESLATINAIDKIDPYHRTSNPDRTLFAMGVSNICSSLVGGLTIIPGGVKSTANIMAGGRTQWANFYNACFLLMFLLFFNKQISTLPLAVLSAVLVFTGYKLCRPAVWLKVSRIGREQLILFTFTILVTLTTDLMWGILLGMTAAFGLNVLLLFRSLKSGGDGSDAPIGSQIVSMFRNPVASREWQDREYHLYLDKPLVCFNFMHLSRELSQLPITARKVWLHVTEQVPLIDHTTLDNLTHWMMQYQGSGGAPVELTGLEQFYKLADSDHATHIINREAPQPA